MNELLVTVMNSARQIMQAQAVNTNNLANASTDGFRAELAYVESSHWGKSIESVPDLSQGALRSTGRDLDVSISGQGWMAVMADDGTEAYSRRGDLKVDVYGQLTNGANQPVMGNSGPISLPPFTKVEIGSDGSLSIQPLGQSPNTMATVDRIKLVSPEAELLKRGSDGLLRLGDGEEADVDASISLVSGSLESSNVNAVAEMVKMIDLSRRFESQVKLMHSAKENAAALSKVMSMN